MQYPNVVVFPEFVNAIINSSFSEESANDDEGDVNGVTPHKHLVKPFEYASSSSSWCWFHGDFLLNALI